MFSGPPFCSDTENPARVVGRGVLRAITLSCKRYSSPDTTMDSTWPGAAHMTVCEGTEYPVLTIVAVAEDVVCAHKTPLNRHDRATVRAIMTVEVMQCETAFWCPYEFLSMFTPTLV